MFYISIITLFSMYITLFLYNFAKVIKRKDIIVGELRFLDYIIHFLFFTSLRS